MTGTQNANSAQPALDNQPPGDRPDDENETFGATIDALLNGDGGAAPVGDETNQNDTGDEDDENGAGAGNDDGGDDAHDAGADGGNAPPAPTATGPGASTTPTGPTAAPSPSRGQTFVVTLRIALTGGDDGRLSMAPYGHMVAGRHTRGVVTADATPAIVRRVALDDAAALGAALLALPGDYVGREAARQAAAAARAEADKQERKEQQATQRKEAAAAKKKADLLAAARRAGSTLTVTPATVAASPPISTPPPYPTAAASDDAPPRPRPHGERRHGSRPAHAAPSGVPRAPREPNSRQDDRQNQGDRVVRPSTLIVLVSERMQAR